MEGQPVSVQLEKPAGVLEKPAGKKRKIRGLPTLFHRKKHVVESPLHEPPSFRKTRHLHRDRGYNEYAIKEIMRKRRKETQHATPDLTAQTLAEVSPAPLAVTEVHTVQESPKGHVFWFEKQFNRARPTLERIGEKAKDGFENLKWGLGWLSRGDITKRLYQIKQNPHAYESQLQAELTRACIDVAKPEDMSFGKRNRKNIIEGMLTASTVAPIWIPTGLSFPFVIYTAGSAVITVNNIYNTFQAYKEKRFRKAMAYTFMTLGGIATGFFPGVHNLTNTWYTELIQKSYDHTETEGSLRIIASLVDKGATADKRELGLRMLHQAVTDSFAKTHVSLTTAQAVSDVAQKHQEEKQRLLAQKERIQAEHDQIPGFFESFRHPKQIPSNIGNVSQLLIRSINLSQELIDVEHKIHTASQLQAILQAAATSAA